MFVSGYGRKDGLKNSPEKIYDRISGLTTLIDINIIIHYSVRREGRCVPVKRKRSCFDGAFIKSRPSKSFFRAYFSACWEVLKHVYVDLLKVFRRKGENNEVD